ncbi:Uncharacterised protein [Bordetella pertussis]|nr:Uncharacterised protein [Bordetella pertussis]
MCRRSAARLKLRSSATATKYRICFRSMVLFFDSMLVVDFHMGRI